MHTILITTSSFGQSNPNLLYKLECLGFKVITNPLGRTLTENEVEDMLERYDPVGVIAGVEPITAKVLKKASQLKIISRCGIGIDNIDLEASKRFGIKIFNTPEAAVQAVAELTVALLLNLIRRVSESDRNIRSGKWNKLMGRLLSDLTIGIIGCGRVGSKVACYLRTFGCDVLGYDVALKEHREIKMVSKVQLLESADVITFHVPATPETINMLDDTFVRLVKKGVYIINTARGEILNEDSLVKGIESEKIAGAAIDTYKKEPYQGPLIKYENVLLTAHMGSYAREARLKMECQALDNLLSSLGESL